MKRFMFQFRICVAIIGIVTIAGVEYRNTTLMSGILLIILLVSIALNIGLERTRVVLCYVFLAIFLLTLLIPMDFLMKRKGYASIRVLRTIEGEATYKLVDSAKAMGEVEDSDYVLLQRKPSLVPTKWCVLITY